MSGYGLRFTLPQNMGAVSTATICSQVALRNAENTVYYGISTFNTAHSNAPYQFKSDWERMQFKLGQANIIGGRNIQNQ